MDVRQRGGFGVQTDISINGGTFDQISILLNGMPLSSPQTGHNAADFPVSLDDIDHIEVLEGAAARVFGSSAFSGAINIVTTSAVSNGHQFGGHATVEGGSYGTFGGDAGASWAFAKNGAMALSGGYTQSDGGTDNADFRKRRGFWQGNWRSAVAGLSWQAGITSQDYGANTFYSARFPNQFEWTRRYMGSVKGTIRPFQQATTTSLELVPMIYAHRDFDHYQLTKGSEGAKAAARVPRPVRTITAPMSMVRRSASMSTGLPARPQPVPTSAASRYGRRHTATCRRKTNGKTSAAPTACTTIVAAAPIRASSSSITS